MDPGILIPFFAIGMTSSIPIFAIWLKHRQKLAEIEIQTTSRLSAEKAAQYAANNTELEERVRVLERIVTDKGYDVASQIEALRDTRRVEELLENRERRRRTDGPDFRSHPALYRLGHRRRRRDRDHRDPRPRCTAPG